LVNQDLKDHRALPDLRVLQGLQDREELQEEKDLQVFQEIQVHPDPLDQMVVRDLKDRMEHQDLVALLVPLDLLEILDNPEPLAR